MAGLFGMECCVCGPDGGGVSEGGWCFFFGESGNRTKGKVAVIGWEVCPFNR